MQLFITTIIGAAISHSNFLTRLGVTYQKSFDVFDLSALIILITLGILISLSVKLVFSRGINYWRYLSDSCKEHLRGLVTLTATSAKYSLK